MPLYSPINSDQFSPEKRRGSRRDSSPCSPNRGLLTGSIGYWIRKDYIPLEDLASEKKSSNLYPAIVDIISQELARLLIDYQPEIRLLFDPNESTYYTLSQEIPHDGVMTKACLLHFENYSLSGLGKISLLAVFLEEENFCLSHLLIDQHRRLVKIGGDSCFHSLGLNGLINAQPSKSQRLSTEIINSLPYPKSYKAHHWLDMRVDGEDLDHVNPGLGKSVSFLEELYETMLKLCILPHAFIDHFVQLHASETADIFIEFLKQRQADLLAIAIDIKGFKRYVLRRESYPLCKGFYQQLKGFIAQGSFPIMPPESHGNLEKDLEINYRMLVCMASESAAKVFARYNELCANHKNPNDRPMCSFLSSMLESIYGAITEPEKLEALYKELEEALTATQSKQLQDVRTVIGRYYLESHSFFAKGMREKAKQIEEALYKTPVSKRGTLITDLGEVAKAIATPRYPRNNPFTFLHANGEVNRKEAARTFLEYYDKHKNAMAKN